MLTVGTPHYLIAESRRSSGALWKGGLSSSSGMEMISLPPPSYLMCGVHSKVFPAVCRVHAEEDKHFASLCSRLRGRLTPLQLHVHSDYSCPYHKTLAQLNSLPSLDSPQQQLLCLRDAMVLLLEMYLLHASG